MHSCVTLYERLVYLRNLEEKKEQVLASIEEQGKLTEELKKQILAAETHGCGRRSVPPVSAETPDTCHDCKRKRTGTACTLIMLQKSGETDRSVCKAICE